MPALLILNYDVHDRDLLHDYRGRATPILMVGTTRLIASTNDTIHLAEAPAGGTHTVVLEFPDVAEAQRVYSSQEYQEVLQDRLRATTPRSAMIVPTYAPA
ncbi:DUF1330 domain-containing protein [Nocardioides sp.]|uniref:DUF1330 domain-containing protein n=1 Tax=Nocardioides sp. TaxID=35761 RepID=UPI003563A4DD